MNTWYAIFGNCYRALQAPMEFLVPYPDGRRFDIFSARPRCETQRFIESGQHQSFALVLTLFFASAPFYVANFIVTVIVNTVEFVFRRRTGANMFKEVHERCEAEFNSSAAIICVFRLLGICASDKSSDIRSIFWRVRLSVGSHGFTVQAPTGLRAFVYQVTCTNCFGIATQAKTVPHRIVCFCARKSQDGQTIKLLSGQIVFGKLISFWKRINSKIVDSHWIKDNSFVNLVRAVRETLSLSRPASILAY